MPANKSEEWKAVLRNREIKSLPFTVLKYWNEVKFQTWTEFLPHVRKSHMPSRPNRVLKVDKNKPRFILHNQLFRKVLESCYNSSTREEGRKTRKISDS